MEYRTDINLTEAGAEMLLGYLYPELGGDWKVWAKGTFYRNYNPDIMRLDPGMGEVELSRDSFLKVLPESFLSTAEEGRTKAGMEAAQRRRRILEDAFAPLDTHSFNERLSLERQVSGLLEIKLQYILQTYFGFDLAAEQNPYVSQVAGMLPYVSHLRGDVSLVAHLLEVVLGCKVETDLSHRYSQTDSTKAWLPQVRFDIIMPDLSAQEYRSQMELLTPFALFLREWFLPFDMQSRFALRQHRDTLLKDAVPVLDYNIEL